MRLGNKGTGAASVLLRQERVIFATQYEQTKGFFRINSAEDVIYLPVVYGQIDCAIQRASEIRCPSTSTLTKSHGCDLFRVLENNRAGDSCRVRPGNIWRLFRMWGGVAIFGDPGDKRPVDFCIFTSSEQLPGELSYAYRSYPPIVSYQPASREDRAISYPIYHPGGIPYASDAGGAGWELFLKQRGNYQADHSIGRAPAGRGSTV